MVVPDQPLGGLGLDPGGALRQDLGVGRGTAQVREPVRGVLTAGRDPGSKPLSAEAIDMITTFAAQAGISLELASRRRDAERVAAS